MSDCVKIDLESDQYSAGREMLVSRAGDRVTFGIQKIYSNGKRRWLICVSCAGAEARKLREVVDP
jgi:hypothetical protein